MQGGIMFTLWIWTSCRVWDVSSSPLSVELTPQHWDADAETEARKTQSKKVVTNTLCFNPCTYLTNLICVSLQVLCVAPVSPYVTHAPLPRPLQQHTSYRWWNLFAVTELWGDGYQPCSAVSGRAGRPQVCLCLPCVWTGPPPLGDYKPLALYKNKWNLKM